MAAFLVGLFGFILAAMFGFTVLRVIARVTRTPGLTRDRLRYVVWPAVVAIIAMSVTVVVSVSSMHRNQYTDQQDLSLERQLAVPALTGLQCPKGVAVDAAGNLYVADVGANRVLKLVAGVERPDRAAIHRPQSPGPPRQQQLPRRRWRGGGCRRRRVRHRLGR